MPTSGCEILTELIQTTDPVMVAVPENMLGIWVYATRFAWSTITHDVEIAVTQRQAGVTTPFRVTGIGSATFTIPSYDPQDPIAGHIVCIPW